MSTLYIFPREFEESPGRKGVMSCVCYTRAVAENGEAYDRLVSVSHYWPDYVDEAYAVNRAFDEAREISGATSKPTTENIGGRL
jgi:hypothetical protein